MMHKLGVRYEGVIEHAGLPHVLWRGCAVDQTAEFTGKDGCRRKRLP
jgi:hypothetical protein